MKDELLAIVAEIVDPAQQLNIMREYLQALTLRVLHEAEASSCIAFVGGTALRFLHNLPRFSEDLAFSVISADGYSPTIWLKKLKTELTYAGFDVEMTWNDKKTVHVGWVKIGGILNEAGLSPMPNQKLSIKIEVDVNPPAGAVVESSIITRHAMFVVAHYDLPSLMAGKLHALLARTYFKGRDWYDFVWYCSQRPAITPNLVLLQNALDQTQGAGVFAAADWKQDLAGKLEGIDEVALINDVRPFLERPAAADLLKRNHLESLLQA